LVFEVTSAAGEAKEIGTSLTRLQSELDKARLEMAKCDDSSMKEAYVMKVRKKNFRTIFREV